MACARLADRGDIEGRSRIVWCVTFMANERQDVARRHLELTGEREVTSPTTP